MMKLLALDIDGTLTDAFESIPEQVINYLQFLDKEGWKMLFVTGRTFQFGQNVLHPFNFPYYLSVQNGAITLEMPAKKILAKKYLDCSILNAMETICQKYQTDFVIYTGVENGDICYYRLQKFDKELLAYLEERTKAFREKWISITDLKDLPIAEFASVKCFGKKDFAFALGNEISQRLHLHVPVIRDPFQEGYYVVQATHPDVNKGKALSSLIAHLKKVDILVGAGDDLNDLSFLELCQTKIVMPKAPQALLEKADIVAKDGIIRAIEAAIKKK